MVDKYDIERRIVHDFFGFFFHYQQEPQSKIPFIVAKAMDTLGPRLLVGYDISCVFGETILSTSLDDMLRGSGSRTCVKAFHGYFHNSAFQCKNHPNNISGTGLEILERVFSSSNSLAAVTQLGSSFQRRLFIEMRFK